MIWLAVFVGGGLGALGRLLVSGLFYSRWGKRYPYATLLVNILGSFLLGVVMAKELPLLWLLFLGTGFMGGFTTFSTCHYESISMWQKKEYSRMVLYLIFTYVGAFCGGLLGVFLAG